SVLCQPYGAPPLLHSFPTRRSSDLDHQVVGGRVLGTLATPLRQQAAVLQRLLERLEEPGPALRGRVEPGERLQLRQPHGRLGGEDRKSTRLNSSHVSISYAVFCLKK